MILGVWPDGRISCKERSDTSSEAGTGDRRNPEPGWERMTEMNS